MANEFGPGHGSSRAHRLDHSIILSLVSPSRKYLHGLKNILSHCIRHNLPLITGIIIIIGSKFYKLILNSLYHLTKGPELDRINHNLYIGNCSISFKKSLCTGTISGFWDALVLQTLDAYFSKV